MELFSVENSILLWVIGSILLLLMPGIALVNALTGDFKDTTTKLTWVLVILFAPLFGWALYFLVGRKQKTTA